MCRLFGVHRSSYRYTRKKTVLSLMLTVPLNAVWSARSGTPVGGSACARSIATMVTTKGVQLGQ
ncbi:hypothetical protein ACFFW8_17360 [Erwinia tracheiphila]